ncbi:major facilitator superfamily domain-containing protein [Pyronema domesticum]|uniref:Similar to L-fucose-proton symporter acc. no. P11551 n=1 Tax=Pyronema omphalodes (strain CBS 100304) TaxID=1076935 RepID=U4LVN9_PYROM|nr:major facilitator superfamily domain-containing protein [Pyronema domesticum]CCX34727.1 Similar to L-fucose-proton symporter; acc. no. P11551 [Pyronema omphalodes CBS 100304]
MGFFKKRSLRARDDQVTNASELTLRQSLKPMGLVIILFFLWGFAYGLLDVLNKHFQVTLDISRARSSGLQAAYFGAYPIASLTYARWVLKNYGYKATFMLGLTLYGVGALLFWPAATKRSFGGFCGATFIIGSGLGTLESACNPYLAVCGPPKYSEMRLNFAQAIQAIGTVVGPILAAQVFFKNVDDRDLTSVQWVYLGIAIFVFFLAGVFFLSDIPEVTDADMARQAQDSGVFEEKPLKKQWLLWIAALSQFCYVGAQVAVAGYFVNYATEVQPGTSNAMGSNFLAAAQGCFAIGRFGGTLLMKFFKPRKVFIGFFTGVIGFCAAAMAARGYAGIAMLMTVHFFESICFPTIFTLGIRGLGRHTKTGSTVIVGAIVGGAVVPPLLGFTADKLHDTGKAMFVPLIFFGVGYLFPVLVNFHRPTAKLMDGFLESRVGVEEEGGVKKEVEEVEIKN